MFDIALPLDDRPLGAAVRAVADGDKHLRAGVSMRRPTRGIGAVLKSRPELEGGAFASWTSRQAVRYNAYSLILIIKFL